MHEQTYFFIISFMRSKQNFFLFKFNIPIEICYMSNFILFYLLGVLKIKPRASLILGKCCTTEPHPSPAISPHLHFKDLVQKRNAKYLIEHFLYWPLVEMRIFWLYCLIKYIIKVNFTCLPFFHCGY
jgi:hypothetical protein